MKKLFDYIKSHKYVLILLYWPFHSLWYELIRMFTADSEVLMIESELDAMIPFCEWFVIPYCIWYICIAAVLLLPLALGKREFLRANLLLVGCMVFPMIFCTAVPNGIPTELRPDFDTLGRENILTKLVELIYLADSPPRNVMPSMHVSVSWAMCAAVFQSSRMKGKALYKIGAFILAVLISAATVFIKQHSILDVLFGVITAIFVTALIYICERLYDRRRAEG